jgi:hypothetical protein
MLSAKIETLGLDPQNGSVVVLLRAENDKLLPIVIGPLEAHHIMVALQGLFVKGLLVQKEEHPVPVQKGSPHGVSLAPKPASGDGPHPPFAG